MNKFFISLLFSILACGPLSPTNSYAQKSPASPDWKKVGVCKISLSLPRELKDENAEGVDSCVAIFSNNRMRLAIDYGWYGGAYRKYDTSLEFKEEIIEIDGKKARLATYVDDSKFGRTNPNRKYVAGIYIDLSGPQGKDAGMKTSLNVKVEANSKKELKIARQIFQSIRFDN